MINYDLSFILLHFSSILVIVLLIYIASIKKKKQIHYIFIIYTVLILIWSIGNLLEIYARNIYGYTIMFFVYFYLIGLSFIPVSLLYVGLIFANTKINFTNKHLLILAFPIIDCLIIVTNDIHKLYLVSYSPFNDQIIYGKFMTIHTIVSYLYVLVGYYYLLYFSIKNSGIFSRQSIFIMIGTSAPFIVNILYTLKIFNLQASSTPIAFSIMIICYAFAIFRFNFLNIVPIALQKVVDHISDSFIVINEVYDIIDYNKTFIHTFSGILKITRNDNLLKLLDLNPKSNINKDELVVYVKKAIKRKKSVIGQKHIVIDSFDKHFTIEITPILNQKKCIGCIILLKDITQHVRNLETIKENQSILIEQERLASLGQLIGGIAHNIRTPIMSISGAIEALKDLAYEYRDSIDDRSVTEQDHKEIAKEMLTWLEKMGPYCAYMSDVISAVKGQAVQMNASTMVKFTVDELVKRVDLLMKHELKKNHIIFILDSQIDMNTEIKGEVSNLIQVFDNIIINAMHAYEGKEGTIELKILRSDDNIDFVFIDKAKGIPKEITDRLFKEMVTTKGKNGTGLGLYMSYATIKGRFGGNISFNSIQGGGTTFYISIPCISYNQKNPT